MATSDLKLIDGEEVKAVMRASIFTRVENPLLNLWLKIVVLLLLLVGYRRTAQITVTNKRLVCESKERILWVFPTAATFRTLLPQGVASVQYAYEATCCWCLCRKYTVSVTQADGTTFGFLIRGGAKVATDFCNLIVNVMTR